MGIGDPILLSVARPRCLREMRKDRFGRTARSLIPSFGRGRANELARFAFIVPAGIGAHGFLPLGDGRFSRWGGDALMGVRLLYSPWETRLRVPSSPSYVGGSGMFRPARRMGIGMRCRVPSEAVVCLPNETWI